MNLLLVNMSIDRMTGGGTAQKTVQLARALSDAGENVTVLSCGRLPTARRLELGRARLVTLPLVNRRFWVPLPLMGRIRTAVAKADVLLISGHWQLLNLSVAREAKRLGKPYVVIPSGALRPQGRSLFLKSAFNRIGGRSFIADAASHIAITSDEVEHFVPYGITPDRVHVIPNTIYPDTSGPPDLERFRKEIGLGKEPFILFIGRLNLLKGPDVLLQAFARISSELPHHLIIAGPDEGLLGGLKATVSETGLGGRVHFLDYLGGKSKQSAYASADLLVIPSREEAMSLVVLEAALQRLPVIATNRCGLNALAADGLLWTVEPSAEALAEKMLDVLRAEEWGRRVADRFREYVNTNLTWDAVLGRYRAVIRESRK